MSLLRALLASALGHSALSVWASSTQKRSQTGWTQAPGLSEPNGLRDFQGNSPASPLNSANCLEMTGLCLPPRLKAHRSKDCLSSLDPGSLVGCLLRGWFSTNLCSDPEDRTYSDHIFLGSSYFTFKTIRQDKQPFPETVSKEATREMTASKVSGGSLEAASRLNPREAGEAELPG